MEALGSWILRLLTQPLWRRIGGDFTGIWILSLEGCLKRCMSLKHLFVLQKKEVDQAMRGWISFARDEFLRRELGGRWVMAIVLIFSGINGFWEMSYLSIGMSLPKVPICSLFPNYFILVYKCGIRSLLSLSYSLLQPGPFYKFLFQW